MVATRSSTGSLPKRRNLAESEDENDAEEVRPRKRTKKKAIKREPRGKSGVDEEHDNTIPDVKDVNSKVSAGSPSPDDVIKTLTEKKGRVRFLLSGPRTKDWPTFLDCTAPAKSRRCRINKNDVGKLLLMMSLPIDVLYEIGRHLLPLDLLYLSRTNRSLYNVFMSKSSRPTWIACRNTIRMPPCPSNLNEPQYASLHFEKTCQACDHRKVEDVMYALSLRLCKCCFKWNVRTDKKLIREYFGSRINNLEISDTDIPFSEMVNTYTFLTSYPRKSRRYFLEVDFVRAVSAYLKTVPDSEERNAFVEKERRFVKEISEHDVHISAWRRRYKSSLKIADLETRRRRQEQIENRLCSLGYSNEEIKSIESWDDNLAARRSWRRLVSQPREVTDRIWKTIRPELEALLQSKRQYERKRTADQHRQIRRSELLALYKDYVGRQPSCLANQVPLCISDLCEIQMVSDMIEEDECRVEITKERWQKIEDEFPRMARAHTRKVISDCAKWIRSAQEHLGGVAHADKKVGKLSKVDSTVDRNAVWGCNAFFSQPSAPHVLQTFAQVMSKRRDYMLKMWLYSPWKSASLQVERLTLHTAHALLSSLGFRDDTTMARMKSLGPTFELVGHVASEIRDYHQYPQSCDIPLFETHKLASDGPIAAHGPGLPKPSISMFDRLYDDYCRTGRFADAAVGRGSLPEPKRRNLAESDESDAEEMRPKKRIKKGAIRCKSNDTSGGHEDSNTTVPDVKDVDNGTDAGSPSPDEVITSRNSGILKESTQQTNRLSAALMEKKGRVRFLLSGPRTKDWPTFSDCTAPIKNRRNRINKGDAGKLSLVMSLPIDVLYEIAMHLMPLDLLYLSRTSRSLYGIFMSRSSRHVWIMCENGMQMLPCPSNLNEPQYASLYFEKTCQACGYRKAGNVIDPLLIRLCQRCTKLNVRSGRDMSRSYFGIEISNLKKIYTLLPWSKMAERDVTSVDIFSKVTSRRFLEVDFVRVVSAYLKTEPGSVERKSFVEKQHHFVEEIMQHEKCITAWKILARKKADAEARNERHKQIADRLHSLGYSYEEIKGKQGRWIPDGSAYWSWRNIVSQPKKLTERAWNKFRPELERLLLSGREIARKRAIETDRDKRKSELWRLYGKFMWRRSSWNLYDVPLCISDLYEIPIVLDMIEEDDCKVEITEERWQKIENELPVLQAMHARKVEFDCAKLLLSAQERPDGFACSDPAIWESLEVDPTVDTSTVYGSNAFFGTGLNPQAMMTFTEIMSCREKDICLQWLSSWQSIKYQVERLVVQTADALLSSMGFPDDTSMIYMGMPDVGGTGMLGFYICACGTVEADAVLSGGLAQVKHVSDEIRDYRDSPWALGVPLYETHKLDSDETIAAHDPDFIIPSHGTLTQEYCRACLRLNRDFQYREQFKAHMKTYHGVDTDE
ncbi:hypothetical protein A7U60_g6875 [Sanghuangporus baumii]|uniref:F-box domain-containing protein n=1 Tax=Sanghuangporus baumii TaxID=108892 RepID=A0A9Q5N0Z3_SANBA|nr:hypothetical protein A7U60_g6875 [Sanghuangporus baumii]